MTRENLEKVECIGNWLREGQRSSYVNSINQSPQSNQSNRRILPFNQIKSHISKVEIIDILHMHHVIV
jgi:hypothetical protein